MLLRLLQLMARVQLLREPPAALALLVPRPLVRLRQRQPPALQGIQLPVGLPLWEHWCHWPMACQ